MPSRLPLYVAIALSVAGMLSIPGCGVRGPLEKPPGAKGDVGETPPGQQAPHKPSILDPLIR